MTGLFLGRTNYTLDYMVIVAGLTACNTCRQNHTDDVTLTVWLLATSAYKRVRSAQNL